MGEKKVWENAAVIATAIIATPLVWAIVGSIIYLAVLASKKKSSDIQTAGEKAFNILFVSPTATGGQKFAHFGLILVIYFTVAYVASSVLIQKSILKCKNGTYSDCTKTLADEKGALGQSQTNQCEAYKRLSWFWGAPITASVVVFSTLLIYAPLVAAQKKYAWIVAILVAFALALVTSLAITAKAADNCFYHCDSAEETERKAQCGKYDKSKDTHQDTQK